VRVNVDLAVIEEPAHDPARSVGIRDELARVVDYEKVANDVRAIVAARHVRLVETLAERIAQSCLADPRVRLARIRVEKLDVFPDAASAGVEIERSQ
jgi:dihydroneopterin aldolase